MSLSLSLSTPSFPPWSPWSCAASFGSCKNTFMASPFSECLCLCPHPTSWLHAKNTATGTELNSTQPNWTEVHCTSLSPSDYTARIKDAGLGGWADRRLKGEWVAGATLRCLATGGEGQPTQIKSRNGPVTNFVDM